MPRRSQENRSNRTLTKLAVGKFYSVFPARISVSGAGGTTPNYPLKQTPPQHLIIERPTPHDPQQQKLRFTLGVSAPNAMLRGAVISVCLSDLLGYQVSLMPN